MSEERLLEGSASDAVLDEEGQVIDQIPDATWEAMCEAPAVKELVVDFGPKYGRMLVKYRPYLSFEQHQALSKQYRMDDSKRRDTKGFMVGILRKVLVAPRIKTQRHEALVLKARFDLLNKIILDSIGSEAEELEAIREDLGP